MTDPDLNAVVDRIIACQYAVVPDGDRAAILRELRAVQAATWREAAEIAARCWNRMDKRYKSPVWDASHEISQQLCARAAALHPKESNDE